METNMPDTLADAVYRKIDAPEGLLVRRGKTFIGNLRRELGIENVNSRRAHEAVRELLKSGRIKQVQIKQFSEGHPQVARYVRYLPAHRSISGLDVITPAKVTASV